MGTDIHYVVEEHMPKYGWVGVMSTDGTFIQYGSREEIPIFKFKDRNYAFFTRLANVRGFGGPDPKGLPKDLSDMARNALDFWDSDGYSHSYCSLKEFALAKLAGTAKLAEMAAAKLAGDTNPLNEYVGLYRSRDIDKYRVVYWFDC